MMRTRTRWALLGGFLAGILLFALARSVCLGAWLKYRLVLHSCPDGALRQTVELRASNLRRGATGDVVVEVQARYTTGHSESVETVAVTAFDPTLALIDAAGKETPLPVKAWRSEAGAQLARLDLPTVPDGDYKLRARVTSRV